MFYLSDNAFDFLRQNIVEIFFVEKNRNGKKLRFVLEISGFKNLIFPEIFVRLIFLFDEKHPKKNTPSQ